MERLDVRELHNVKRQRDLRDVLRGAMAVAGVTAGLFFVWLAFTLDFDPTMTLAAGFLKVLAFVFGVSLAIAGVSFALIKS